MKRAWNVFGNERLIQRLGSWLRYTGRHWLTKAVNFCWKFWNSRCESCSFKISWILFSGRGEPSLTCPSKLVRRLFWLLPSLSLSWPSAVLCSVTCSASASIRSLMHFMAKQWWSTRRCYGFSFFLLTLVTFTTLTFPSTAQPVHLCLLFVVQLRTARRSTRIASPFLFHHCYAFLPSWYAVPLGLCASSCSINATLFPM